jgi:hypothetical protein
MAAAIAGWLYEVWPANPYTLAIAGVAVLGGPLLGIVHVAIAEEHDEAPVVVARRPAPARPAAPVIVAPPIPLTPRAEAARQFSSWRDRVHPAIERREREARASQYIRSR